MQFLNPWILTLLPPTLLAVLSLLLFGAWRSRLSRSSYGDQDLLAPLSSYPSKSRICLQILMAMTLTATTLLALARPVVPDGKASIARGTLDVVAVVDVSRSMAALDYEGKVPPSSIARPWDEISKRAYLQSREEEQAGTRLEMVRHLLSEHVIPRMSDNQLGIVSYAGEAFPQSFLSNDSNALSWIIERGLTISSAPGEGSDIGKALELAAVLLAADSPAGNERLLILFSDGGLESSDDTKPAANRAMLAELLKEIDESGTRVVIVGLGNHEPSAIPVSKLARDDEIAEALMHHGKTWFEIDGQIEKTALDARLLKELAAACGGTYIHLRDIQDLDIVSFVSSKHLESAAGLEELFWAPLALSMTALLILIFLERKGKTKHVFH